LLEYHSSTFGGSERWNLLNRNNQVVASGVYFYHIESGDARRLGRFVVVNFARQLSGSTPATTARRFSITIVKATAGQGQSQTGSP
jgi:hypothetical protein